MYEAATKNLRTSERFLLEPALSGHFGTSVVSVCDISAKGARIKHVAPLEMGHKSALRLAVDGGPKQVSLEAVIVWTQRELGAKNRWLAGVRTYGSPETVQGVLTSLQSSGRTVRIEELRSSDRFTVTPALDATWNDASVRIEYISARGSRIESPVALEASNLVVLRFVVPSANVAVEVAGTVAWAS